MKEFARKAFRTIYKSYMVEGAKFDLKYDIPICPCTATEIPKSLVYYNDPKIPTDFEGFVHFYIDDYKFESIWRNPKNALQKLRRFAGVITPDFSTYQDMPAALKIYNTYRMRAFGYWLGKQGLQVINNVRWGTPETYKYCFDGIEQNSMVCISSLSSLGTKSDAKRFTEGLAVMVETLKPSHILFYGKQGRSFMDKYIEAGMSVTFYDNPDVHTIIERKIKWYYRKW